MSNEPKWTIQYYTINPSAQFKINGKPAAYSRVLSELNRLEAEVERLTIEKKLQYDDFRSERNAMEDKISELELQVERLRIERDNALEGHKLITNAGNGLAKKLRESQAEVERLKKELLMRDVTMLPECDAEIERLTNKLKNKEIQLTAEMNMRGSAERQLTSLQSELDRCKAERANVDDMDEYAISFKNWFISRKPSQLCTVHPPAGSGGSMGIYNLTDKELLASFRDSHHKTNEG